MNRLPDKLLRKLQKRKETNSLRSLTVSKNLIDFSSNDYLGFSSSKEIYEQASVILKDYSLEKNGATGSRLLSGNNKLFNDTENFIANFHNAQSATIFNSGYDANVGFFSTIPQRGDFIFYDELIHASIRDGVLMSAAKAFKFIHNDINDLEKKLNQILADKSLDIKDVEIYVVTESVFSMDGDSPDLVALANFCEKTNCHLIIDEAHAVGVLGKGKGMVQELAIEEQVFARIITFGKALGCHGAVVLGNSELKTFLINFCRTFIYTTALPPHSLATIFASYKILNEDSSCSKLLNRNIAILRLQIKRAKLETKFISSNSAIHCCIIPGNTSVKNVSVKLIEQGFDVKPILSPTVPVGKERLRFCIHNFNTENEIKNVVKLLATFV